MCTPCDALHKVNQSKCWSRRGWPQAHVRRSGHYHSHRNRLGSGAMAAGFRWRLALVQGVAAREFAPPRSFAIIQDITDQKRAEEQLRVLQEMACTAAA